MGAAVSDPEFPHAAAMGARVDPAALGAFTTIVVLFGGLFWKVDGAQRAIAARQLADETARATRVKVLAGDAPYTELEAADAAAAAARAAEDASLTLVPGVRVRVAGALPPPDAADDDAAAGEADGGDEAPRPAAPADADDSGPGEFAGRVPLLGAIALTQIALLALLATDPVGPPPSGLDALLSAASGAVDIIE